MSQLCYNTIVGLWNIFTWVPVYILVIIQCVHWCVLLCEMILLSTHNMQVEWKMESVKIMMCVMKISLSVHFKFVLWQKIGRWAKITVIFWMNIIHSAAFTADLNHDYGGYCFKFEILFFLRGTSKRVLDFLPFLNWKKVWTCYSLRRRILLGHPVY